MANKSWTDTFICPKCGDSRIIVRMSKSVGKIVPTYCYVCVKMVKVMAGEHIKKEAKLKFGVEPEVLRVDEMDKIDEEVADLGEKVIRLQSEVERLRQLNATYDGIIQEKNAVFKKLWERLGRLEVALGKYGVHPIMCATALGGGQFDSSIKCTCGFSEALAPQEGK